MRSQRSTRRSTCARRQQTRRKERVENALAGGAGEGWASVACERPVCASTARRREPDAASPTPQARARPELTTVHLGDIVLPVAVCGQVFTMLSTTRCHPDCLPQRCAGSWEERAVGTTAGASQSRRTQRCPGPSPHVVRGCKRTHPQLSEAGTQLGVTTRRRLAQRTKKL